jgi:hypothetical protein
VNYRFFGREPYTNPGGIIVYLLTDRASVGDMIAYLFTECALGTGGSHFESIGCIVCIHLLCGSDALLPKINKVMHGAAWE